MNGKPVTSAQMKQARRIESNLYYITDWNVSLRIGKVQVEEGNAIQWQVESEDGIVEWGDWTYKNNTDAFHAYATKRIN